jgi:hypothetical protein
MDSDETTRDIVYLLRNLTVDQLQRVRWYVWQLWSNG